MQVDRKALRLRSESPVGLGEEPKIEDSRIYRGKSLLLLSSSFYCQEPSLPSKPNTKSKTPPDQTQFDFTSKQNIFVNIVSKLSILLLRLGC